MKNLILLSIISLLVSSCDLTSEPDLYEGYTYHSLKLTASGNTPIAYISTNPGNPYKDGVVYYGLPYGESFEYNDNVQASSDYSYRAHFIATKHTDDGTTLTLSLEVDSVVVDTQSTTASYGTVEIDYTIAH